MNPTASADTEAATLPAPSWPSGRNLWQRYHQDADTDTEDHLVQQYLPLVKTVVGRLAMTLPGHVALDDLNSAGLIGLLQALRSYQPGTGASFETFARFRIRGAVLDELRRMDWVPRSVHDKARKLRESMSSFEQQTGRAPDEEEMAEALNLSVDEYRDLLEDIRPATFVHLDSRLHPDGADTATIHESIADDAQEIPAEAAARHELIDLVMHYLDKLPRMQRQVLSLYYVEDLRLKEIAAVFNLTESRISQIHSAALLAIRGLVERHESRAAAT
jgi:RNA polymerase sigma factor for flagellar operon FliA